MGNQPTRFKAKAISANVWTNKTSDGNTYQTVTLDRAYNKQKNKTQEPEWEHTSTFRAMDIPNLKIVLDEAYKHMIRDKKNE